ncbi:MAG: prepilin-type N-terminal cleavage/methylation domain-containing protein [Armatimonadetes bacterium]|nr:prepilin-type N-terminal cleavage/methylation domain-containing protein [Armatimonadota bacterium]
MKRGHEGFTLVELLVVIGVVGILASLLMPAFSTARERARQVHCASNQRQLAVAFNNYATDWDGVLPRWWTPSGGPANSTLGLQSGQRDWAVDTLPYVVNERLYICPSKYLIRGYGANLWLATPDGTPLSNIEFPTRTLLFTEIMGRRPTRTVFDFTDRSTPEGWPVDVRFTFDPRHNGGANIAFADGHVKWVRSSSATRWSAAAERHIDPSIYPPVSLHAGGTPVGTYWWPTATAPGTE